MPNRVKATNSLEALLKKSPPSTSNAGFNQVAVLIWTFVIQVARAVMDWSQAHFEEMAPLLRASEAVQKKSASPSVKCGKCSAKGHQASACRSKNPAAVRRRIAANHKKRNRPTPLPVYANAIAPHYPFPFIAPQELSYVVGKLSQDEIVLVQRVKAIPLQHSRPPHPRQNLNRKQPQTMGYSKENRGIRSRGGVGI
ncbi:hypothetical protein BU17DRAFT_66529 [Hysterangium stoloniferum]|nr:hypothetical protein BU17DRAFT_66529 [Hysterangium stoloniferum]